MNEFLVQLRDALREELDATNTYTKLLACAPAEYKSNIEEVMHDEINHQGRLLDIIMKVDPSQIDYFNKGLEQEE